VKAPERAFTAEDNRVLSWVGATKHETCSLGTPICVCTGSAEYAHEMAEVIAEALNAREVAEYKRATFAAKCARYAVVNSVRAST
jgi:hypothetical protein